jgi:GTP cyclohydrolase I
VQEAHPEVGIGNSRHTDPLSSDLPSEAAERDFDRARLAVADLLTALGVDPGSEIAANTPRRVVAALAELLTAPAFELTTFPNTGHDDLVLVKDIPFRSLCAHHLLPFRGTAHVALVPGKDQIVGLSKVARVVETAAAALQVQEELTQQIAGHLDDRLEPRGVGVIVTAEHLCMTMRGTASLGATTVTVAVRGVLRDDPLARAEFMSLAGPARSA